MAIGNGDSCRNGFPNTRAWEQQEWNKIKKQTNKRDVSVERSEAGTKKRSPDCLSHPNQNTIIINIIW